MSLEKLYMHDEYPEMTPDLHREGGENDEIHYRMTYSVSLKCGFNVAFGKYMRQFSPLNPDLFVFTANSAIPVADAVRGWYEAMGTSQPRLSYVLANRELSAARATLSAGQRHSIKRDAERLRAEYTGARAVLVDQFVHSGGTLKLARSILDRAGIEVIASTDESKWYNHAFGEIDPQAMTSEHARFMRHVGREAVHRSSDI